MAAEAVSTARALLREATGDADVYWVSGPGEVVKWPIGGAVERFDLSSGASPDTNLNRVSWTGNDYAVLPDGTPLEVAWIYVDEDGRRVSDPATASMPVVGRYAFWVDDESARINLNTSWKRSGNTNFPSHPSTIGLESLPGITEAMTDTLRNRAITRPFNSVEEAEEMPDISAQDLRNNRFSLTHYSHESDVDPWGDPRIVLTTKFERANPGVPPGAYADDVAYATAVKRREIRPYLRILTNEASDPGLPGNLNNARLEQTIAEIRTRLQRTNWPYVSDSSASFAAKYGGSGRDAQLAVDIVDYVRAVESNQTLINPIRGTVADGVFRAESAFNSHAILGTSRTPLITEIGIWVAESPLPTGPSGTYPARVRVELHLPEHYGISSVPVAGNMQLDISFPGQANTRSLIEPGDIVTGQDPIPAGGYLVVEKEWRTRSVSGRPDVQRVRVALLSAPPGGRMLDVAPLDSDGNTIACPIDLPGVEPSQIRTVETNDPRINRHRDDWSPRESGNSLGHRNSLWMQESEGYVGPPQDREGSSGGSLSDAALFMPAPSVAGVVRSVAELGKVGTGQFSALGPGVPWRSLRFQPTSGGGTSFLPDWALIDCFVAPSRDVYDTSPGGADYLYHPYAQSTAGRVNINTAINPFGVIRREAVAALLHGTDTAFSPDLIESNIRNRVTASGGLLYDEERYVSAGELAEIAGIADGGERTEENLAWVLGAASARGNVFGIYALGQALQETPSGDYRVNSERYLHVLLERYEAWDAVSGEAEVRFRVVNHRQLTP